MQFWIHKCLTLRFWILLQEETPLFLAAREGSYETAKLLLDHLANRDITDHLDQLPRDIANERMHHDIVHLLEEYNLVQTPPTLTHSPPICSPEAFLGIRTSPGGNNSTNNAKKPRKPGGKEGGKEIKLKKKKNGDTNILSPMESDISSPPMMTSPFQQSPPITHHLHSLADSQMGGAHPGMAKPFDSGPPRLSHLGVANNGGGAQTGPCDWLVRAQQQQQGAFSAIMQTMHHGANLPQVMGYPTMQSSHLGTPAHLLSSHLHQNHLQHQNSNSVPNHGLTHHFLGDISGAELQSNSIQTVLPQETQHLPPPMSSTQFLTPPSQHSYSTPMDNTPNHQPQVPDHPFLTPSPGSPDQWSSCSPHSNLSDWSEGISSPPTNIHMNHIPEAFM